MLGLFSPFANTIALRLKINLQRSLFQSSLTFNQEDSLGLTNNNSNHLKIKLDGAGL